MDAASQRDTPRTPLEERFPELAGIDAMDDTRRIDVLRDALGALQRELDSIGG